MTRKENLPKSKPDRKPIKPGHETPPTAEEFEREGMGVAPKE
ncbi:hypothetical protein [Sphingomonas limnosediminicola]